MKRLFLFHFRTICSVFLPLIVFTAAGAQELPLVAVYPMESAAGAAVNNIIKREQLDQYLIVLGAEESLRSSRRF